MVDRFERPARKFIVLRLLLFVVLVVLGLGTAAFEKHRSREAFELMGKPFSFINDFYLDPVRDAIAPVTTFFRRIPRLWDADKENGELKRRLSELNLDLQLSRERAARLERLSGLGRWSAPPQVNLYPADIISFPLTTSESVMVINRGERDGLEPRDPVVALDGLIGIVREVADTSARVQTLQDTNSAVGVLDREMRTRGVVRGQGSNQPLMFVPENEAVAIKPGAVLITSGFENSLYPKGITIGTIVARGENPYGEIYGIVEPAVQIRSVEEVLVLSAEPGAFADNVTDGMGQMRVGMPNQNLYNDRMTSPGLTYSTEESPAPDGTSEFLRLLPEREASSRGTRLPESVYNPNLKPPSEEDADRDGVPDENVDGTTENEGGLN